MALSAEQKTRTEEVFRLIKTWPLNDLAVDGLLECVEENLPPSKDRYRSESADCVWVATLACGVHDNVFGSKVKMPRARKRLVGLIIRGLICAADGSNDKIFLANHLFLMGLRWHVGEEEDYVADAVRSGFNHLNSLGEILSIVNQAEGVGKPNMMVLTSLWRRFIKRVHEDSGSLGYPGAGFLVRMAKVIASLLDRHGREIEVIIPQILDYANGMRRAYDLVEGMRTHVPFVGYGVLSLDKIVSPNHIRFSWRRTATSLDVLDNALMARWLLGMLADAETIKKAVAVWREDVGAGELEVVLQVAIVDDRDGSICLQQEVPL